jgi:FAD/FMN-containing dehydrogenase
VTGTALIDRLVAAVGAANVLLDDDVRAGYERDWTGAWSGRSTAVVRPGSTAEVAAVVRACARAGVAVVTQGGNTGLVGGAVPEAGAVVLSTARLNRLDPVDVVSSQVTAGAGVPIALLQAHAAAAGLAYGVDWGARDSATVGGSVATNAGGLRVLRYGDTRAQVRGLEWVTASGEIVSRLDGLLKDNTGPFLPGLLVGSEGTFGIVTAARLALVARLTHRVTALVAVAGVPEAVALVAGVRAAVPSLEAAELVLADGLGLVVGHLGLALPFAAVPAAAVLLECADRRDPTPELAEALGRRPEVIDAAVATEPGPAAALWRLREAHTEVLAAVGPPLKLDVAVAPDRLPAFTEDLLASVASRLPGARPVLFGHVGDGNLHVNLLGVDPHDHGAADLVLGVVARHHGSISAEHGIGRAKKEWLHLTRSDVEIALLRRVKAALDPQGILNPGVLLPDEA